MDNWKEDVVKACPEIYSQVNELKASGLAEEDVYRRCLEKFVEDYAKDVPEDRLNQHDFEDISLLECYIKALVICYDPARDDKVLQDKMMLCCKLVKEFFGLNERFDRRYQPQKRTKKEDN